VLAGATAVQSGTTMITFDLASENLLSLLGAAYDIVGAILLAWGLTFVKARSIRRQAATGWGYSPTLMRVFCEQRIDAWAGLILLSLGFSIQGAAGWGYKTTRWEVVAVGGGILAALVALHFLLRHRLAKRGFVSALRSEKKPDGTRAVTDAQVEDRWRDTSAR
jgi:hypothetical protein